jgi:hypothetical protein
MLTAQELAELAAVEDEILGHCPRCHGTGTDPEHGDSHGPDRCWECQEREWAENDMWPDY